MHTDGLNSDPIYFSGSEQSALYSPISVPTKLRPNGWSVIKSRIARIWDDMQETKDEPFIPYSHFIAYIFYGDAHKHKAHSLNNYILRGLIGIGVLILVLWVYTLFLTCPNCEECEYQLRLQRKEWEDQNEEPCGHFLPFDVGTLPHVCILSNDKKTILHLVAPRIRHLITSYVQVRETNIKCPNKEVIKQRSRAIMADYLDPLHRNRRMLNATFTEDAAVCLQGMIDELYHAWPC